MNIDRRLALHAALTEQIQTTCIVLLLSGNLADARAKY